MATRQALLQLRGLGAKRAWRVKPTTERVLWWRGYHQSASRWQEAIQHASFEDGLPPPLIAPRPRKIDLKTTSQESIRPTFSSLVTIDLDGTPTPFSSIFLRDSCHCARCVDPSSSQKNFRTPDIPAAIEGSVQVTTELENEDIALITWKNDIPDWPEGHQTALSLDFLRKAVQQEQDIKARVHKEPTRVFWENKAMTLDIKFIDYESYMRSDETLHHVLQTLHTHALVFLKNVPDTIPTDSAASVTNIVERIGTMRDCFYGRTWDVRSVPNATNVAYTHVFLALHMDLCYLDLTPHLQFLHSLRARAPGGESMFSDSFHAAETIRSENPEFFKALCTFPVTFHYFNAGQAYRQIRTTIELVDPTDLSSPIKLLNWSPPFQGPFTSHIGSGDQLKVFHAATQRFDELISARENMYEYRMAEGECVIFDNRRVLHARRAFGAEEGERWMKGAYLDRDVYASKLRVLDEMHGRQG